MIKQYDETKKVLPGYGDDYTTGCLLDYAYFKDHYRLIAVDLSKWKTIDADPRAIQQILFQGVIGRAAGTKIRLYTILEKPKKNKITICKRNSKSYVIIITGWI